MSLKGDIIINSNNKKEKMDEDEDKEIITKGKAMKEKKKSRKKRRQSPSSTPSTEEVDDQMIDDEEVGTLVPPATVMKRMVTKSHDNDDDVDDNNQDLSPMEGITTHKPWTRSSKKAQDITTEEEEDDIDQAFEKHYLRQLTAEYADELDGLRAGDDFSDASLPILMTALRQGTDLFSREEKKVIVEAVNVNVNQPMKSLSPSS